MALACEFDFVSDVFGISETPEYGIPIDYSEACDTFIKVFLEEAQDAVPVDTGTLLGSISGDTDGDWVRVEADTEYAQYVEFGTYKMAAQPYFVPACYKAQAAAIPIALEAIEEAFEEEEEMMEEEEEEEEEDSRRDSDMGRYAEMSGEDLFAKGMGGIAGGIIGAVIAGLIIGFLDIIFEAIQPGTFSHGGGSFSLGRGLSGEDAGSLAGSVEDFIYID